MGKFIRVDCFLSTDEYQVIQNYYKGYKDALSLEKHLVVPLEEGEKLNLIVSFENKEYGKDILVTIKSVKSYEIDNNLTFIANNLDEIIGVKKLNCRFLERENYKDTYNFFININREYDEEVFKDEIEYHMKKANILRNNGELNPYLMYEEIAYQDFSNEFSMFLSSYCLFTNSKLLLEESYIFDLYEEKLNFNGIFLEEFISPSITYDYKQCLEFINKCESKTEIFEVILMYIATIKYDIPYFSDIENDDLSNIGYELFKSYLKK